MKGKYCIMLVMSASSQHEMKIISHVGGCNVSSTLPDLSVGNCLI